MGGVCARQDSGLVEIPESSTTTADGISMEGDSPLDGVCGDGQDSGLVKIPESSTTTTDGISIDEDSPLDGVCGERLQHEADSVDWVQQLGKVGS